MPGYSDFGFIRREAGTWKQYYDAEAVPDATVTIDQAIAWKFLTKRTDGATARLRYPSIRIERDAPLGEPVLEVVSIMA